jgi:hypothetical protein
MVKTTLRIPDDLYEKVERLAERDLRSVNQQLVYLIGHAVAVTDESAEKYSQVCDVTERMWQHWPLKDDDGMLHTSSDARAAARRIFEILGLT